MNFLVHILVAYRKVLACLALVGLVLMGLFIGKPTIDGHLAGFDFRNNPYYITAQSVQRLFASPDVVYIKVIPKTGPFDLFLNGLDSLDCALKAAFHDVNVQSLHEFRELFPHMDIDLRQTTSEVLTALSQVPVMNAMVSQDKQSVLVVVALDSSADFEMDAFSGVVHQSYPGIDSLKAMSRFHVETAVAQFIRRDLLVLGLGIVAISALLIGYTYRNLRVVLLLHLTVGMSLLPVLFLLSVCDININIVTVLVFPLVVVLSLSDGIHLVTGYIHLSEGGPVPGALEETVRRYVVPSFMTSLTTAIAFLSFVLDDALYIRQFGLITGLSIMFAFVLAYLTWPFMLGFIRSNGLPQNVIVRLTHTLSANKRVVAIGLVVLSLPAVWVVSDLKFQTSMENFFPEGTDLRRDHLELQNDFYSMMTLNVLVGFPTKAGYPLSEKQDTDELMQDVLDLTEAMASLPGVGAVHSVGDVLDLVNTYRLYPGVWKWLKRPFVTEDQCLFRIEVKVQNAGRIKTLSDDVLKTIEPYQKKYMCAITSPALIGDYVNAHVATSLFRSLILSALLIFGLFFVMVRSVVYTVISLVVNVVPLAMMVLIFYVGNIPINIVSAMTAVVCLGLIVDDTVHVLYRILRTPHPLAELGFGMLTTSLILVAGFAFFYVSSFGPTQTFGVVCAAVFMFAIVSDLTLLPVLLKCRMRQGKE